ncbi:ribonuclease D [Sessilibacter corallicola]|uniref:Ribonuclease D n=1 Tax=Sessilibacter corallicola TaxID=2904075 RepID=A0ABQ0A4K2_9GAMM
MIDNPHYTWVECPDSLTVLCRHWSTCPALAIDTEFVRTDTFFPEPGLIQINDGTKTYLIDPQSIGAHQALAELLCNEQVVKVMHACSEDLEIFQGCFKVLPRPVFDTQIAAAFAGFGFSLGYASLVRELMDIELPKDATRSNWLLRPLADVQKRYAALDVEHLLVVYQKLVDRLTERKMLDWVLEDCKDMLDQNQPIGTVDPEYYKKIKLAWKLNPRSLAVLKALCIWREQQARERNVPRNRILKDQIIYDMARFRPPHFAKLTTISGLNAKVLKKDGKALLDVIRDAQDNEVDFPQRLPKPLPPQAGDMTKTLRSCVHELAEQLNLPPEILVKKQELQRLVRSILYSNTLELSDRLKHGWRANVIAEPLVTYAKDCFDL